MQNTENIYESRELGFCRPSVCSAWLATPGAHISVVLLAGNLQQLPEE